MSAKTLYLCQRCGAHLASDRNLGGVYTTEGPACECDRYADAAFKVRQTNVTPELNKLWITPKTRTRVRQRTDTPAAPRKERADLIITKKEEYELPLLLVLSCKGPAVGDDAIATVLEEVYEIVEDRLTPDDHGEVGTHPREPRWRNNIRWLVMLLRDEGVMDRQQHLWALTDKGKEKALAI